MNRIIKARETMTAKERVRRTFNFERPDRVPIDYSANETVNRRLLSALGIKEETSAHELYGALGIDSRMLGAHYVGKPLFKQIEGLNVDPVYGFYSKWIPNEYGGYNDFCFFPLKDASSEEILAYPVPSPDDFCYDNIAEQVKMYKGCALYVGNAGICDIINSTGRIMGMEDTLVNLQLDDEATLDYVDRKIDMELGILERVLDRIVKAGGEPDCLWIGEDLGTQIAPMISRELFDRIFKPIMIRFVDLANSYSVPTMIHTCGSSSWAYEDFIKIGIRAVDTLQPEAAKMSPEYLVEQFGGRLNFHGCISTAAIADASADEVTQACIKTLETMKPAGGYHFAPTHMIQDNTPVENIIAMYNAAHAHGTY